MWQVSSRETFTCICPVEYIRLNVRGQYCKSFGMNDLSYTKAIRRGFEAGSRSVHSNESIHRTDGNLHLHAVRRHRFVQRLPRSQVESVCPARGPAGPKASEQKGRVI